MMWLPLQVIFRSTHGEAYMNPVPVIDQNDGTIFLVANLYPQPYKDENRPFGSPRAPTKVPHGPRRLKSRREQVAMRSAQALAFNFGRAD